MKKEENKDSPAYQYNVNYPSIESLRKKAQQRIPKFAFEYLDGGCNEDLNLYRNTNEIRAIELDPVYIKNFTASNLKTELFGHEYDAPFGIAPVGLQGLIWPRATEILAASAKAHNVPFILSTVATASIEKISAITDGRAWFQLYNPAEDAVREDILKRLEASGYQVLVLLSDVPVFGFRPRDIKNGLAMPPRMTVQNIVQIMSRPSWALQTLMQGQPEFATLKKYMTGNLSLKQLGLFMNKTFSGRLNHDRVAKIRDRWKGKIVMKGVATLEDAEACVVLGVDGLIVSNHGGRQLDAGPTAIKSLLDIAPAYKEKLKIMMDSGLRSGPDVARALAAGAEFTFLGRSFMYSVAALGEPGGDHMAALLKTQLKQVMEQLGCEHPNKLPKFMRSDFNK